MDFLKGKKVVIIADWLTNQGGAERVVSAMADLFPEAPIYTSVFTPGAIPALEGRDVRGTWLQKLPAQLRKKHQFLLPFLPAAFERLDLSEFDIIISSSSAFAKSVRKTRTDQVHFCYCHSPTRYLYHAREEYLSSYPLPLFLRPFKFVLPMVLNYLTKKDQKAAAQVDFFISNSDFIATRIETYYARKAETIYPCIKASDFAPVEKKEDYFLALGRFIPYKRFDLLVEAFKVNGLPLKLGGVGPELSRCKALAASAPNIEFLEFVPTDQLANLYAKARAFLFPAEEDFGLTPVEAMCSGTPVVALGSGGALESVTEEVGCFFEDQTAQSLQKAIDHFLSFEQNFSTKKIVKQGHDFDEAVFQKKLLAYVEARLD